MKCVRKKVLEDCNKIEIFYNKWDIEDYFKRHPDEVQVDSQKQFITALIKKRSQKNDLVSLIRQT